MKHTLTTLIAALAVTPSLADTQVNLLHRNYWTVSEDAPGMVTFNGNGTLTMTGIGAEAYTMYPLCSLNYSADNTYKMANGSSLSLTLQLNAPYHEYEAYFTLFLEGGRFKVGFFSFSLPLTNTALHV